MGRGADSVDVRGDGLMEARCCLGRDFIPTPIEQFRGQGPADSTVHPCQPSLADKFPQLCPVCPGDAKPSLSSDQPETSAKKHIPMLHMSPDLISIDTTSLPFRKLHVDLECIPYTLSPAFQGSPRSPAGHLAFGSSGHWRPRTLLRTACLADQGVAQSSRGQLPPLTLLHQSHVLDVGATSPFCTQQRG